MTLVEPKISDVVVKNITFFLVQPPERRSPKISGAGARETPFQGLFSPPESFGASKSVHKKKN